MSKILCTVVALLILVAVYPVSTQARGGHFGGAWHAGSHGAVFGGAWNGGSHGAFLVTLILVLHPGVLVTMAESIVGSDRPGAASIAAVFGRADTTVTTVIGAKAIRPIGAGVSLKVFWLRRQLIPITMLGSATITDSKCLLIIVLLPTACSAFGLLIQPRAPISAVTGIPIRARERWT